MKNSSKVVEKRKREPIWFLVRKELYTVPYFHLFCARDYTPKRGQLVRMPGMFNGGRIVYIVPPDDVKFIQTIVDLDVALNLDGRLKTELTDMLRHFFWWLNVGKQQSKPQKRQRQAKSKQ